MVTDLTQSTEDQNKIKIKEINEESENNKEGNSELFEWLYKDGVELSIDFNKLRVVYNLSKYQEAIVCFNKALTINPKTENAWIHKGYALLFYLN